MYKIFGSNDTDRTEKLKQEALGIVEKLRSREQLKEQTPVIIYENGDEMVAALLDTNHKVDEQYAFHVLMSDYKNEDYVRIMDMLSKKGVTRVMIIYDVSEVSDQDCADSVAGMMSKWALYACVKSGVAVDAEFFIYNDEGEIVVDAEIPHQLK